MFVTVLQFKSLFTYPMSCSCDRSLENGMKSTMLRRALDLLEPAMRKAQFFAFSILTLHFWTYRSFLPHTVRPDKDTNDQNIVFIYFVIFSSPLCMALSFRSVLAKVWMKSAKAPWRLSSSW